MPAADGFASALLGWYDAHGRHDLPWAIERTPYRVWLSEIMLQQTQVATVIPYFERFVSYYPDVASLAAAALDEVLHLWAGLGYYSRARNLHRCAGLVVSRHGGEWPRTPEALCALPGIGRSTAAAILAQAFELPHAILDGNVKRVLARYHGIAGWPDAPAVQAELWQRSERHLPARRVRDYTQALMDFGATQCRRTRPRCDVCPLAAECVARASGRVAELPGRRPRRALPERKTCFLVIENAQGAVLLEQRPASGIWGGLWCFPEASDEDGLATRIASLGIARWRHHAELPAFTHTFTHFKLHVRPVCLQVEAEAPRVAEGAGLRWHSPADSTRIGLPAPVLRLLQERAREPAREIVR